ncbi:MAG: ice-binding family protein [Burkholderiales bacterium]
MKLLWRYLKQQKWLTALPLLLMTAYGATAIAAQAPSFSSTASGTTNNLTLTANMTIGDADLGKTGNTYLGFNINQTWYFNNGAGWVQFNSGALPIYATAPLANQSIEVVRNADLSSLIGGQVYVGYGLTESDMLTNNKFAMVYTVTASTTTKQLAPVLLGTSGNFAILAKTAVSTVPQSAITGDVGVSPAATSFLTGFSLTMVGTTSATSTQVTGNLYGADMTPPTSSNLTTAVSDMETAYTDAAGRTTPDYVNLGSGNIGGLTLASGLYTWGSSVTIPANVTISGGPNDVWIFQISGDLIMSAAKSITLSGGAQAKNIFWQVAGQATLGAGAHFEGNILSQTAISLQTGATMNGRALAQTQVALDQATITKPAP